MHQAIRTGVRAATVLAVWLAATPAMAFGGSKPDQDGDGVVDFKDACPDTSGWWPRVHTDGCPFDRDFDGVIDAADRCDATPVGAPVDAHGCPFDSDGDTVLDHLDRCPNTPSGLVTPDGCPVQLADAAPKPAPACDPATGCADADSDGDGVPNAHDRCPGTPVGTPVGADGCPIDRDGDGIADALDQCPNTPAGLKVLPNGCALHSDCRRPLPNEPFDAAGCADAHRFILSGVKFEFDSARLTTAAKKVLDAVAETLAAYPDVYVDVQGHTDSLGTDAYNLALSERRARSVVGYLAERSIDAKRMTPIGYGESVPMASNRTAEGQEENRRVEFRVRPPR